MDMPDLLSAWPIESPADVVPLTRGRNNRSYTVTTPTEWYILRIYQNTAEPERVRYEHILLMRLEQVGLPFSVPAPIPARSGSTVATVDGGTRIAALFRLISGRHPDGQNLRERRLCGAALARLDQALQEVTMEAPAPHAPFGDLAEIHPSVPDPTSMIERLPLEGEQRAALLRIVGDLSGGLPALYRALPRQIIHGDFDASNVLVEGERVTGVLDFEFAGPDLRALDLARCLSMFRVSPWESADGWQLQAFYSGYREHVELTPDEREALPDLMNLYRVVSLLHWEGRRREGLASEDDVRARARALLRQDEWLQARRGDLVTLVASKG